MPADRTRITNPIVQGGRSMVEVWGGAQNVSIEFNPDAQQVTNVFMRDYATGMETYKARTPTVYTP
jgi:hypothetical protein